MTGDKGQLTGDKGQVFSQLNPNNFYLTVVKLDEKTCDKINCPLSPMRREENMDAAISLENVSKDFGKDRVLKSVTRDFERGKIHGLTINNCPLSPVPCPLST